MSSLGRRSLPASRPPQRPDPPGSVPPHPQPRAELSDAALVSKSWGMALATLVSRITGFAQKVLLAAILGAALTSAFSVANQLPNLIAALVLEATFTAIFVPVLVRAEQDDADRGATFVRRLVTLATALLAVTTALSVAAVPLLVRLMLGHDPRVNQPLTTAFAYLLVPQVIFYGLSSVFMAILNTRNVFGPPAWAPVVNNVVAIATLGLYLAVPGELSVDPVRMGNAKLLVLGIGTTTGVLAQTAVLLVAIRRHRISLRPLWGIDERLKRFGAMASAMVLYVLISQLGLVVTNQIASAAAASGPAIYNYTWLVLMLPFGMIGVTVLTAVTPRLSRNAAADDTGAVLADLSLATRLTMITLIPAVALMTVCGPAIGSALFAYGNFGDVDAGYLGTAIALSAFTLIPYALVLLGLRVFYAREQPWTPILIIVVVTGVKVGASLLAPHITANRELVAGYLGLANGLGFLAGVVVGYFLLRNALRPPGGHLVGAAEVRTVLVTVSASLAAGLIAHVVDRLVGLATLTGVGSLLRVLVLGAIMAPVVAAIMVCARLPEAKAALAAVRGWAGWRRDGVPAGKSAPDAHLFERGVVTYPGQGNPSSPGGYVVEESIRRGTGEQSAGAGGEKGPEVTDGRPEDTWSQPASADPAPPGQSEPDGPVAPWAIAWPTAPLPGSDEPDSRQSGAVFAPAPPAEHNGDFTAEPRNQPIEFDAPREAPASSDDIDLVPGTMVGGGRYRLLMFHGGTSELRFWQALDTALDRQVALTFVDPDGRLADDEVHDILSRTLRLSRINQPGVATVLDVVHTGTGGLVVAEWIRGGSLREVANTSPSPVGAARAMQTLVAAAEAAHEAGVALSVDHPSRVRVSIDGDVVLSFPATMPDATTETDIRGIGAALYALLVDRWPLPEYGVPSGMAPAPLDNTGQPVEPSSVDHDIPFQISAAVAYSLQDGGGIHTAAKFLNLLQQAATVADHTDLLAPIDEPPTTQPGRLRLPTPENVAARNRRRRNVMIGTGAAVAVIVVALLVLASVLGRVFGDLGGRLDKDRLGLHAPSTSSSSSSATSRPDVAGSLVKPLRATVFSPEGDADEPDRTGLAIDGNPDTAWATDTYHDAAPFPGFKNGVGLLLALPAPTAVGTVTIDISSTGTQVQIRSARTSTPAQLGDTTALTQPVSLHPGHNSIAVNASAPTSDLLVWISTLGTTDGKSRADISEITVRAAS